MIADNQWHTYTLDMSQNPEWTDYSPAIMRIDPTNVAGAHFEIDYIRTTDAPVPGTFAMPSRLMITLDNSAFMLEGSFTDPYGIIWSDNQGDEVEPHGYTGQEREADLDLYHYGARMYMPELGRFLQVDPAREFANPYSYVGNKPSNYVDNNGKEGIAVQIEGNIYYPNPILNAILPNVGSVGAAVGRKLPISEVYKSIFLRDNFTRDDLLPRLQTYYSFGKTFGYGSHLSLAVSVQVTLGSVENITKDRVYGLVVAGTVDIGGGASIFITEDGLFSIAREIWKDGPADQEKIGQILLDSLVLQVQWNIKGGGIVFGAEVDHAVQTSDYTSDELFDDLEKIKENLKKEISEAPDKFLERVFTSDRGTWEGLQ